MEEDIEKMQDFIMLLRDEPEDNPKAFLEIDCASQKELAQTIEKLINKYKEQEAIITDLKEFKNSMAIISEICVDESKCHITSREAVEEIRKNIFWKAKGE